jgi:hypothetical protein
MKIIIDGQELDNYTNGRLNLNFTSDYEIFFVDVGEDNKYNNKLENCKFIKSDDIIDNKINGFNINKTIV